MRDIEFNHVAIVVEGRAGADVVVGDSKEKLSMTKPVLTRKAAMVQGAVLALVRPKLATDAKIDLTAALKGVTSKNYDAMKGVIVTGINAAVKGKLAQDADIGDLAELLDALAPVDAGDEDPDDKDADAVPLKNEGEDDADTPLKAHLKGKLSDDDYAKACDLMGGKAKDAEPEPEPKESKESKEPKAKDKGAKDAEKKEDDDKVSKAAMDSAISAAVTAAVRTAKVEAARAQREIRDAEAMVQPYVGRLSMAHDSAEGVLRTALTMLGVSDVAAIHASALPAVLKAQPVPGAAPKRAPIAQDAKAAKGFADRYPDAVQVRSL